VSGESGQPGLLGKGADWFDRRRVTGLVALVATAFGIAAALPDGGKPDSCTKRGGLDGVYKPSRLKVIETCVTVTGTVVAWRHEHDGDYHVSMVIDGAGWTNDLNVKRQHGFTVVEFVPRGPHVKFRVGQRLRMLGTKVLDLQHGDHHTTGWIEIHPVFKVTEVEDGADFAPNPEPLAPPTEEEEH
jgi:hypothetical protein